MEDEVIHEENEVKDVFLDADDEEGDFEED